MNNILFFLFLSFQNISLAAEEDRQALVAVERVENDLYRLTTDVLKLIKDTGSYIYLRVPGTETLAIDGAVDATLQCYPPVASHLKKLKQYNPTNAAIVRDASKLATVGLKMLMGVAVDKTGRRYDVSDVLSQATKFSSKVIGFAVLAFCPGLDSPMSVFLINTAGDIFGQTMLESGESWRHVDRQISFGSHLSTTWKSSLISAGYSVPSKAVAGYLLGETIKWIDLDKKVENAVLDVTDVISYYVIPIYESYNDTEVCTPERLEHYSMGTQWTVNFMKSVAASAILTTGCKAFIDIVRSARRSPYQHLVTPILVGIGAAVSGWMAFKTNA